MEKLQQVRSRMHVTLEGESLRLIGTAVARALAGCTDVELSDREAVGRRVLDELRLRGFSLLEAQLPPASTIMPLELGEPSKPTAEPTPA